MTDKARQIFECDKCGGVFLPPFGSIDSYYESHAYRQDYDGGDSDADFFRQHDGEQLKNLAFVGTQELRGSVLCDVGCGAGSFLDLTNGYVDRTIAIEPDEIYRESLHRRGHEAFAYVADALPAMQDQADIVTMFSVIEHVEDPLKLLEETIGIIKPGGRLVLSTPNLDDLLLTALGDVYAEFYYRQVHLWYFSSTALANLLKKVGFEDVRVECYQRFGLSNFMHWLRDSKPRGDDSFPGITESLDALWRQQMAQSGRGDYLVAHARRS
ncbi:MAG: class I SAM-dependent methyltransferase [Pseudomonadales bacterium]|nr:class I SAM-dependent methyltransferase [Pseudomonadales bacterium]MBO7004798.1 class I SAM-dependent methyltransferase [Pseudomonadales bacterium]